MSNATLGKFGCPATVIEDGPVWTVLLRFAQVTLCPLVLVCKEPVQAFSELSKEAFADTVTRDAGWPGPPSWDAAMIWTIPKGSPCVGI